MATCRRHAVFHAVFHAVSTMLRQSCSSMPATWCRNGRLCVDHGAADYDSARCTACRRCVSGVSAASRRSGVGDAESLALSRISSIRGTGITGNYRDDSAWNTTTHRIPCRVISVIPRHSSLSRRCWECTLTSRCAPESSLLNWSCSCVPTTPRRRPHTPTSLRLQSTPKTLHP